MHLHKPTCQHPLKVCSCDPTAPELTYTYAQARGLIHYASAVGGMIVSPRQMAAIRRALNAR